jgi:hypothetical protein
MPYVRDPPRCSGVHANRAGLAVSWVRRSASADAFVDSWVSWREASEDVRVAYRRWSECARPQRALAFACYRAALDREQHAASIHSDWAERVRAMKP